MRLPIIAALTIAIGTGPASAQVHPIPRGEIKPKIDPGAAKRLPALRLHLADLADGSYIADINGRGRPIEVRNGMTLVFNGKGFGARSARSIVTLSNGTTGPILKIIDWSETRVTVVVPVDQNFYTADTNGLRLRLQGPGRDRFLANFEVTGVRFRAN